jgi:hypothetical protein
VVEQSGSTVQRAWVRCLGKDSHLGCMPFSGCRCAAGVDDGKASPSDARPEQAVDNLRLRL